MVLETAVAFSVYAATLYAAHGVADHVTGQTDRQAAHKAAPGRAGWTALAGHLAGYHATLAAAVALVAGALGVPLSPAGAAVALVWSVATHAALDRRWPLVRLLEATGAAQFAALELTGPTGAKWFPGRYGADQALHVAALWGSALALATL